MNKKTKFIAGGILLTGAATLAVAAAKNRKSSVAKPKDSFKPLRSELTNLVNPITAEPATPLQTASYIDSLSPSLMTRDSKMQGVATGVSVLNAKAVSNAVEKVTDVFLGKDRSYTNKLFTRGTIALGGIALSRIPEKREESLVVSGIRSAGSLLTMASVGGIIYDTVSQAETRVKKKTTLLPLTIGALLTTGIIYRGKSLLDQRRKQIDTVKSDPTNKIVASTVAALTVVQLVKLLGIGFQKTRNGLKDWLGEGPLKSNVANIVNLAFWAGLGAGAYFGVVSLLGKVNSKIEQGYDKPPTNPNVSGSTKSVSKFEDLGHQGRRFVTDVVTPSDIKQATGKNAKASPIRVYIGIDGEMKYHSARAEMAIAELRRTKAFDRKYLLLVSPTGTGWIDQTMIDSAELLSQGDIATVVVQYAKTPSFLSVQNVVIGRRQFRRLLWSVKMYLADLPKRNRPKILVFGESLGAWASSDTVMHTGIDGFDHYGIDRALWVGMPGLSKWGKIEHGESEIEIPDGSVQVFDNPEQYEKLSPSAKSKLRAIILNHDNDPIARMRTKLIIKKPDWLDEESDKGRGVPAGMQWSPLNTFVQVMIDAANAMRVIPGHFRSHGHDYRADMAYFVNEAYQFGASRELIDKVNDFLIQRELDRAEKTKRLSKPVQ